MKTQRGFTLVEIMIAIVIAAILAIMGFEGMRQALANRERIRASAARLQAVQFTMRSFVQDISQVNPRPVREPLGPGFQPAVIGGTEFIFTRAGWSNPAGGDRATLQRVRYALRDKKLYRDYWTVLDAQINPEPVARQLLDRVKTFKVRYMNDGRKWQDDWPPPAQEGGTRSPRELGWRPIAVEITLELEDFGTLTRLIEVAG
jgi:general secretion pathway protein J